MTITELTAADVKHYLRTYRNMLLKDFAEKIDCPTQLLSDVIQGRNKGTYGKGREIKETLERELAAIKQEIAAQNTQQSQH